MAWRSLSARACTSPISRAVLPAAWDCGLLISAIWVRSPVTLPAQERSPKTIAAIKARGVTNLIQVSAFIYRCLPMFTSCLQTVGSLLADWAQARRVMLPLEPALFVAAAGPCRRQGKRDPGLGDDFE